MSQPDPTYDEDRCMCEYWTEIDSEHAISIEYCKCRKSHACSCSGLKSECSCGNFTPQIREDYEEDR